MNDREMMDYTNWLWADTVKEVGKGLLIYAVLLGSYWLLVA